MHRRKTRKDGQDDRSAYLKMVKMVTHVIYILTHIQKKKALEGLNNIPRFCYW